MASPCNVPRLPTRLVPRHLPPLLFSVVGPKTPRFFFAARCDCDTVPDQFFVSEFIHSLQKNSQPPILAAPDRFFSLYDDICPPLYDASSTAKHFHVLTRFASFFFYGYHHTFSPPRLQISLFGFSCPGESLTEPVSGGFYEIIFFSPMSIFFAFLQISFFCPPRTQKFCSPPHLVATVSADRLVPVIALSFLFHRFPLLPFPLCFFERYRIVKISSATNHGSNLRPSCRSFSWWFACFSSFFKSLTLFELSRILEQNCLPFIPLPSFPLFPLLCYFYPPIAEPHRFFLLDRCLPLNNHALDAPRM